mgnify:FL=1
MARYIEQGKSIFIPFKDGYSITDSQLHLRMYKTVEMFKRYGYTCGEVDVLCEYAPVVRCKDCKHYMERTFWGIVFHECWVSGRIMDKDDFCSYGERKDNDN